VLDPFVGSGTTAVAAKKLGINYIGIDANEKYVKISEKRIRELEEKL
jgi:DNA modification methylase